MLLLFEKSDRRLFYADHDTAQRFSSDGFQIFPEELLKEIEAQKVSSTIFVSQLCLDGLSEKGSESKLTVSIREILGREIIEVVGQSVPEEPLIRCDIESLLKRDQFLLQIFKSSFHSVIIVDPVGKILHANETGLNWLKYSKDELLGRCIAETLHSQQEIAFLKARISRKLPDLELDDFETIVFEATRKGVDQKIYNYLRKDCSSFPVNLNIFPVFGDNGSICAYAEIAMDLSTFRETENRLIVSERTMATIVESAVEGIVIIDETGLIVGFNTAAEKMFKIPALKALGKNVSMLMPEPHKSRHDDYLKNFLKTGIPHVIGSGRKVDAVRGNGELFPIDLAVGEVKLEGGSLFTGFIRDITESRKLESERNRFFQSSLDLFCMLDFKGNIRNANPRWYELLGYQPEEIHGASFAEFLHPDDLEDDEDLIREIVESEELIGKSFRFRSRDGLYRWILWNSSVDHKNKIIYGVARDVTDQRRMVDELRHAKAEAERMSAARGLFIAKMSHELRTPLNSIIGFSGILQKNLSGGFSEKDLLYLDRIKRNGATLLKLINSILEFSKTKSGFQEVNSEEVNIGDMLAEIVDLMQVTIEEKQIRVVLNLPDSAVMIRTDQVKFRQIIQNLIDNAVKFSEGGRVDVELKIDPITACPVYLDVHDSGLGISEQHLARIFEAFQQCDNTVTRRYGGAGLGLAIAKSFAQLLGFGLEVDSKLGKGSCFRVTFTNEKGTGFE